MFNKKPKLKIVILILAFALVPPTIWAIDTVSSGYKTTTSNKEVNAHGTCQLVKHTGGTSYFVPTKTSSEWSAFRSNKPSAVQLSQCTQWVRGTGSCSAVCSAAGKTHTPDSRGNRCSSGEANVRDAILQLGTGILIYGCWGGACPNGVNFSNTYESGGMYCYYPGQKLDWDATDRTVACPCQ